MRQVLLLLIIWGFFLPSARAQQPISPENVSQLEALLTLTGHNGWVNDIAWRPDSTQLASGGEDGSVRLWEIASSATLHLMNGHQGSVVSVAWRPDGAVVASGSLDDTIRWWDAYAGVGVGAPLQGHTGDVWELGWSANGSLLASVSDDMLVNFWDGQTGALSASGDSHENPIYCLAWNGGTLATADVSGTIILWDGTTQTVSFGGDGFPTHAMTWVHQYLAVVGESNAVAVWDVPSGTLVGEWYIETDAAYSVAFSPDGGLLAVGGRDGVIYLFETATGTLLHTLAAHTDLITSLAFSPNGMYLASASYDSRIQVWGLP
ncbi:MAG: WD40 repeat domain-containing protein [Anaerolineae bacterium]|nr:WD40 repeat domain-containing protein [Anaerolineae bacterium]